MTLVEHEQLDHEQPSSRNPRTVLITGGAGFIGANFVYHWCKHYPGDRVVVLDALTYAGNRKTLAPLEGPGKSTLC